MGPMIILDKNVIQSLPKQAVYELSRYFYTNVTPILLMEILADLSKDPINARKPEAFVQALAHKILPTDSFPNVHFYQLCGNDLIGNTVNMSGRPIVGGGQTVMAKDGSIGVHFGVQPQNEAVLRWQWGEFSADDIAFAKDFRKASVAVDLEALRTAFPKTEKLKSLAELEYSVGRMLAGPELQPLLLAWFMTVLRFPEHFQNNVMKRWKEQHHASLAIFAPYFKHCLRVHLLFHTGVSNGLLSTKRSNIVDVEYLYYTPFCQIFSTGDAFLKMMASLVLTNDQTLVDGKAFNESLVSLAKQRETAIDKESVEPDELSQIQILWKKHLKEFSPQARHQKISPEKSAEIMKQIKPFLDAADKAQQKQPPNERFPV